MTLRRGRREKVGVSKGMWWRFDRYEIVDGTIRPAISATGAPYDPWTDFNAVKGSKNARPYEDLIDLARALPEPGGVIAEPTAARIAAWCAEHGLLGLLLHRALFATLAPTEAGQPILMREADHWCRGIAERFEREVPAIDYRPVDRGGYGDEIAEKRTVLVAPEPMALVAPLLDGPPQLEGPAWTWNRFFFNCEPTDSSLPTPLTPKFWEVYAEPVDDFLAAAHAFVGALRASGVRQQASLTPLLRTVQPHLNLSSAKHQVEWASTSLLGTFAMMAALDLVGATRVLACPRCSAVFVTHSYQTKYCSPTCARYERTRRFREKSKKHRTASRRPASRKPAR